MEKFCDVYEELYNSSGSEEALEEIKGQINDLIVGSDSGQSEVLKITGDVVKEAACKMKPGKVTQSLMHQTYSLIC